MKDRDYNISLNTLVSMYFRHKKRHPEVSWFINLAPRGGLEPPTNGLTVRRFYETHTKTSLWCAAQSIVRTGLTPITLISYYGVYFNIYKQLVYESVRKDYPGGPKTIIYIIYFNSYSHQSGFGDL